MNAFNFELAEAIKSSFHFVLMGYIIGSIFVLIRLFFLSYLEKPHYD